MIFVWLPWQKNLDFGDSCLLWFLVIYLYETKYRMANKCRYNKTLFNYGPKMTARMPYFEFISRVLAFHLNVTIWKYHKSWPTYTLTNPSQSTRLLYTPNTNMKLILNDNIYNVVHTWSMDFKQCWTFSWFIYRGPFHKWHFASNSNSMEFSPCYNSVASHQIATHFCTCHDGTTIVPCTNIFSGHRIRIDVRVKRNFHGIWCDGKTLLKQSPDLKSSWIDACKI